MSIKKKSSFMEAIKKYFEDNGSMIIAGAAFMSGNLGYYHLYRAAK